VAEELGRPLADVFIEIALRDDLETEFEVTGLIHSDPVIVSLLLSHPAMQIGSADAGAHIAQFAGAGDTCYLFQRFVRELGYFSVEQAVRRLTRDLAEGWHIADRGEIRVGKFADLVLFDPETIARGPEQWVQDLPDGGGRYIRNATGVDLVMVNGEVVVDHGAYTNARPGRVV
jgi:N-acyl-D-aspartate/D-glutamate deacylase